jgi:hypothetical protein
LARLAALRSAVRVHHRQDEAIADVQVMLQEMGRHYRKRPII